jgi:predicted AlkP superfamily phosphohydrolase/phosphomutase
MSDKISYVTLRVGLLIGLGFAAACVTSSLKSTPARVANPPSILVLGLDGIPYSTFKKLQDGGHFRSFNNVSPMIASFPSISDPNWDHLLGLGPEPGFTKAFFDPTIKTEDGLGQENGSILAHFSKEPEYERAVDFKVDGALEHLSTFIWTDTMARYLLESLESNFFKFSKSGRDVYFALIINSDLLSHIEGELPLMKFLSEVEDRIDSIQNKYRKVYGRDLEVILVSDHGNAYFNPVDIEFQKPLENLGWKFRDTLSGSRDVAFYVPEILSFGAFYCLPASSRNLALDFSKVDRVQSTMYNDGKKIHILSGGGRNETTLEYDPAQKLINYTLVKGRDPLNQIQLFDHGKHSKVMSDQKYFEKTAELEYPNALVRIWEGFNRNSKTKPNVLVNPLLGYVFGNGTLRFFTNIRGFSSSHGSLHRDESRGIFVSTARELPTIRPQDFRKYVPVEQLKKAL